MTQVDYVEYPTASPVDETEVAGAEPEGAEPADPSEFVVDTDPDARPSPRTKPARPAPATSFGLMKLRYPLLEQSAALFGVPDGALRMLARRARPLPAPRDGIVVRQGQPGETVFVVASGRFEVSVAEKPGHSVGLAILGPSDMFGEEAGLGLAHQVTVRAIEDGELLALDRNVLLAAMPPGSEPLAELGRFVEQRRSTIEILISQAKVVTAEGTAVSLAVYSPKGGSGRTTVAINLAAQLARQHPAEVILVDLALPYNHVALMSNLIPTGDLAKIASVPGPAFEEAVLSALLHHPSGFMVLPAAIRPEAADLVTPALVERSLEVLKRTFRYIIFDLSPAMSDAVLLVLERANRILLLATPELATIKDVSELQRIFSDVLHIGPERVMVAVNHRSQRELIDSSEVAKQLKRPILCEFQYEGSRLEELALREGAPLSVSDPRSSMARGTAVIAEQLDAARSEGVVKPGRRRFGFA